jgi:hypothetical protein
LKRSYIWGGGWTEQRRINATGLWNDTQVREHFNGSNRAAAAVRWRDEKSRACVSFGLEKFSAVYDGYSTVKSSAFVALSS